MACNCFPIAGDIDSIREWIVPGVNGLLVDPHNPQGLTDAILLALSQTKLRDNARIYNQELIKSKAEIEIVEKLLSNYYSIFLTNRIS
jgi:glycosyltransferase involved in cell wall biosynthesis